MDILPVPCLFIYALMIFVVNNSNVYQTNTSVHHMNTSQQNKLHAPTTRFSSIQRGRLLLICSNIQQTSTKYIFKFHNNVHIFKTILRSYLIKNAFYFIENFFLLVMIVN